jgi:hypothetical protein
MRTGDFSADNFGNPVGQIVVTNPYMSGASAVPNLNPNPNVPNNNIYSRCDPATGNPMPLVSVASGQQYQGTPCNKIPGDLFNSIGKQMIALYSAPTPGYSVNLNNFQSEPVRSLYETKFDIRVDQNFSSADSLFARFRYDQAKFVCARRRGGILCGGQCLRQQPGNHQPRPERCPWRDARFFHGQREPIQLRL